MVQVWFSFLSGLVQLCEACGILMLVEFRFSGQVSIMSGVCGMACLCSASVLVQLCVIFGLGVVQICLGQFVVAWF